MDHDRGCGYLTTDDKFFRYSSTLVEIMDIQVQLSLVFNQPRTNSKLPQQIIRVRHFKDYFFVPNIILYLLFYVFLKKIFRKKEILGI